MKIAHIVTYVSPDGAFGGPVRVAESQCKALAERGHEVTLWAAAPVDRVTVDDSGSFTRNYFPARRLARRLGFAGMWAEGLPSALFRTATSVDIAHVHLARDLVTLPSARALLRAGTPYVAQTHGMVDASRHPLALPIDAMWTRPLLRAAHCVLSLTAKEDDDLRRVEPTAKTQRISNGIEIGPLPEWDARPPRVLFLSRLHPRKRPVAFVEMAAALRELHPQLRFILAGPDEGELHAVEAARAKYGLEAELEIIGAVDPRRTDELLRSASVFVLPSVGEVFPMALLESMRAGTPSVVTSSLGIADACVRYGAAVVTDGSVRDLADGVSRIVGDPNFAQRLRLNAQGYLRDELDIAAVVRTLEGLYVSASRSV